MKSLAWGLNVQVVPGFDLDSLPDKASASASYCPIAMISKRTIPDLSAWHQAHGTQHQLRISSSCTRPVNRVCAQAKDVGSSSQGYLVQKGDTLFEISQTSGVSMKQLRELNPQLEFKAVLLEGQKLTLPVIATSTDNPSAPAQQQAACSTSAPASGGSASGKAPGLLWGERKDAGAAYHCLVSMQQPARVIKVALIARLMLVLCTCLGGATAAGSQHVHTINVEEAQQLYDSMYELTNTHDTILVVYAPWCKYCKNMEAQVRATSASHDTTHLHSRVDERGVGSLGRRCHWPSCNCSIAEHSCLAMATPASHTCLQRGTHMSALQFLSATRQHTGWMHACLPLHAGARTGDLNACRWSVWLKAWHINVASV